MCHRPKPEPDPHSAKPSLRQVKSADRASCLCFTVRRQGVTVPYLIERYIQEVDYFASL